MKTIQYKRDCINLALHALMHVIKPSDNVKTFIEWSNLIKQQYSAETPQIKEICDILNSTKGTIKVDHSQRVKVQYSFV